MKKKIWEKKKIEKKNLKKKFVKNTCKAALHQDTYESRYPAIFAAVAITKVSWDVRLELA